MTASHATHHVAAGAFADPSKVSIIETPFSDMALALQRAARLRSGSHLSS